VNWSFGLDDGVDGQLPGLGATGDDVVVGPGGHVEAQLDVFEPNAGGFGSRQAQVSAPGGRFKAQAGEGA